MTNPSTDEQRFARLHVDQMTDEQKIYFNSLMAGPISGTGSKGAVSYTHLTLPTKRIV